MVVFSLFIQIHILDTGSAKQQRNVNIFQMKYSEMYAKIQLFTAYA